MKRMLYYEAPESEIISLESINVLCSSVIFGEEGGAAYELLEDEDIWDGGSF